jgi:hypothetical protein
MGIKFEPLWYPTNSQSVNFHSKWEQFAFSLKIGLEIGGLMLIVQH